MARVPIWRTIATTLSDEIAAGHYRPGDRMPTEAALSARFGVNRHTVRRALGDLAERGILRARRGSGVYVEAPPADYPIARRTRFHRAVEATGKLPAKRALCIETRRANDAEAVALGLGAEAEVVVYEGISLTQSTPVAHFISVFSAAMLPELADTFRTVTSVTEALRRHGIPDYVRRHTRISVDHASATQALNLNIREGDSLLKTENLNTDPGGAPVEYGLTWFVADRVSLTVSTE